MLSAIDVKYLLNELETTAVSVIRVLPTLIHMGGGEAEERRDIKDLTPSQTLPIFFWLLLKSLWKKLLLLILQSETILFN